jgi:glycosyltransferase involved in cell wall biosynthesis
MKILWFVNVMLPEVSLLMSRQVNPYGGWLVNTSQKISNLEKIELYIAFPMQNNNTITYIKGEKIIYIAYPWNFKKIQKLSFEIFEKIISNVNPNLVHIFGTEFSYTYVISVVCKKLDIKAVISIQGLVSIISKYYMANLPIKIQKSYTIRDFVKHDNLIKQQKSFFHRGSYEKMAIKNINYIIGRTTWDRVCVKQMNPDVTYFHCNEVLREEFYQMNWSLSGCVKYRIFISQSTYPVKGLHYLLEALLEVIKKYPETTLYIAGKNITAANSIKEQMRRTSYGKFVANLIMKNNLSNNVVFTGELDVKEMRDQYLKSNVFVCPSSIENSPNSLAEAMILGVPSVASYVGGIPDMLKHQEEGFLYQADAPYMLAYYICEIFKDENLAIKLSKNAHDHALSTHNQEVNHNALLAIYQKIINPDQHA